MSEHPLHWLDDSPDFPSVDQAWPDGLLAVGGELTPTRVLQAYRRGIFPWFSLGQPPLWWSPDPRMVVFPAEYRPSRSLHRTLSKGTFCVRFDSAFERVIQQCAETPRAGQRGTWLTPEMQQTYIALHRLGHAHSVETWLEDKLVGGLYGLAIGRMFYGESMFSHHTDASKVAFAHLVHHLHEHGFALLDCQVYTDHLASLGGVEIPRAQFIETVAHLTHEVPLQPDSLWVNRLTADDWKSCA